MKKFISILSASAIALSACSGIALAETEKNITFDEWSVNPNGQVALEDVNSGAWGGDDTFLAQADGVLGKTAGDKSVKLNAYYEKSTTYTSGNGPHINISIDDEADLSQDFYVTNQVYLPKLAKGSLVRLGGEYYDGTTRKTAPCLFLGTDQYTKIWMGADNEASNYYGWYEPDNWYTVVFAYSKEANKASWYIDGEKFGEATITTSIKNLQWGIRFDNDLDNGTQNLTTPNWAVIDDYKLVNGTYNPTDSDGDITSSDSTIKVTKSKLAISKTVMGGDRANLGTQISVVDGTTVADVEAALTATYGTDVYVADINEIIDVADWSLAGDNADALKTVIPAQDAYITPSMKAIAVAKDGSLTFYHITVTSNGETLLSLASGSSYKLDGTKISGVKDATTVAEFKANFVASGELKFYSPAGYELKDATTLETGSTLRAYSSTGNIYKDYTVTVDGGSTKVLQMKDITSSIESKTDDTILSQYASGALTAGAATLPGFAGKSGGANDTNTYTKVTRNGNAAYKFESDYVFTRNTAPLYWETAVPNTNTKKFHVMEFTIEPQTNGRYMMYHKAVFSTGTQGIFDVQQYSPDLTFEDGAIYLGGKYASNDNRMKIGTYENGGTYNVSWVIKTPESGDKAIYVQGVYVNGTKIFPLTTSADYRNCFYDETTGYYVFANRSGLSNSTTPSMINSPELVEQYVTITVSRLNSVFFGAAATSADVDACAYYSNMKIYGADEFPVAEVETPDVILDLTSDIYQVIEDAPMEGADVVKGYSGTVENVLSNLDSDVLTTATMFYSDGVTEVNPQATAKAGMIVRVSDLLGENVKDYTLSDTFDAGVDESMHDADNEVYYASRTVQKYTSKTENFMYVAAIYDKDGRLIDVDTDVKTVSAPGALTFSIDLACDVELKDGAKVKTMLLNPTTLKPYISAYVYDEVNGGSYDGEIPATNY